MNNTGSPERFAGLVRAAAKEWGKAARFEFSGEVNPEFQRRAEILREPAFYTDVFDVKTTNQVVELAAATGSLGPANQGSSMLKTLRDTEAGA